MPQDLSGIFKPEAKTIKQVFSNTDSYYQIPDYQRPYSWADEQIEQLWDDLYSAMESGDESYFLGPIILIRTQDGSFEVVDGQQRLTTLTILFCVLRDLYFQKDNTITNAIKSLVDQKYRLNFRDFRLTTQPNLQNQFEQEILNGIAFSQRELSRRQRAESKFFNAALIFRDRLQAIESKDGEIARFVQYLLDKVILITITCSNQSFAIKLFQVLNARGLDLSPADLIKSYLYSHAEHKREQFVSDWRAIEAISERIGESVTDLFTYYEYYLLARNPKRSLYEELTDEFKNKDANQIVYETKQFIEGYDQIYQAESKAIYPLWYLPNQVFWKAILTTARYVNFGEYDDLCTLVRNVFYAYWVAGYTTSKIKQTSFNLIAWVKGKRPLSEIQQEIRDKMAEDSVVKRASDNLQNDAYGESWLKPLLVLLEYAQTDDSKLAYIELDTKLHVDHILPQGWREVPDWRKRWSEEQAELWLNRLGNLTLLSGKKNIAATNDSFTRKKDIYRNAHGRKVAFEISKPILDKAEWTEDAVRERQEWMVAQIEQLLELSLSRDELKSPEPILESTEDVANGVLIGSSPTTREWLGKIRAQLERECPELQYKEAKYWAGFLAPSIGRKIADLNPQPKQIRLFLTLPPSSHPLLETSPGSRSWADWYRSVYNIKSGQQIEEAVKLIIESYKTTSKARTDRLSKIEFISLPEFNK